MSAVSGSGRLIRTVDDIRPAYAPAGMGQGKIGIESELSFFEASTGRFMGPVAHSALVQKAAAEGLDLHLEPFCDGVEVSSIARPFTDIFSVIDDISRKTAHVVRLATAQGLKRSFFEHAPQTSTDDLLKNITDVERFQVFFAPPRADMIGIARYFTGSKSLQVSVSYESADHLLRNMRRLSFLTPFLFLLCENTCRFRENSPQALTVHAGMDYRTALGPLGGIPDYVFTAQTGAEMIEQHIESVFDAPLFTHFDRTGAQIRLPERKWTTFRKLTADGLNTEKNYYLAQSILWRDIAIRPIRDEQTGAVTGHRYETRMFGNGMHQHQTATMLVGGLAFLPAYAADVDALLKEFGFDMDRPAESRALLKKSYESALHRDKKFFDISYGTGVMADFARRFGEITAHAYAAVEGALPRLPPLLHICQTGRSDSFVNAALFSSLPEILCFQKEYDAKLMENPALCTDLALSWQEKERYLALCA